MALVLIVALVVLSLLSVRFGADSRPGESSAPEGWFGQPRTRAS